RLRDEIAAFRRARRRAGPDRDEAHDDRLVGTDRLGSVRRGRGAGHDRVGERLARAAGHRRATDSGLGAENPRRRRTRASAGLRRHGLHQTAYQRPLPLSQRARADGEVLARRACHGRRRRHARRRRVPVSMRSSDRSDPLVGHERVSRRDRACARRASERRRLRRDRDTARAVRRGSEGVRAGVEQRGARPRARRGASRVSLRAALADEAAAADRVRRYASARPERQAASASVAQLGSRTRCRGADVMSAASDELTPAVDRRARARAASQSAATFSATRAYRGYVLALLVAVGVVGWVDRNVFAVLLESIKLDFDLSDTQLGLLGGAAFGVFYAAVGLPVAWLADRSNRSLLLASALGLWSVMTAACGLA